MKNAILVIAFLVCFTGSSVAADFTAASGTYISQKDNKEVLILYPDATFHLKQRKKPPDIDNPFIELSGKYELTGETVKLILQDGGTGTGQLKGNVFQDTQGDMWIKQTDVQQNVQRPRRQRIY